MNAELRERVENLRSGVRIRPVIERECYLSFVSWQPAHHSPEHEAVPVERAVYCASQHGKSEGGRQNHAVTDEPRTAAYTSSTDSVTLGQPYSWAT